jgi:hypothetical protein
MATGTQLQRICFVVEVGRSALKLFPAVMDGVISFEACLCMLLRDQGTAAMSAFWRDIRLHCIDPILNDLESKASTHFEVTSARSIHLRSYKTP